MSSQQHLLKKWHSAENCMVDFSNRKFNVEKIYFFFNKFIFMNVLSPISNTYFIDDRYFDEKSWFVLYCHGWMIDFLFAYLKTIQKLMQFVWYPLLLDNIFEYIHRDTKMSLQKISSGFSMELIFISCHMIIMANLSCLKKRRLNQYYFWLMCLDLYQKFWL